MSNETDAVAAILIRAANANMIIQDYTRRRRPEELEPSWLYAGTPRALAMSTPPPPPEPPTQHNGWDMDQWLRIAKIAIAAGNLIVNIGRALGWWPRVALNRIRAAIAQPGYFQRTLWL